MANTIMAMLADVPPMLATAWAVWFIVGGGLIVWYRRAVDLEYVPAAPPRPVKPTTRSSSAVRRAPEPVAPVEDVAFEEPSTSQLYEPPQVPRTSREKVPVVIGDPFGDLATLLDQRPAASAASVPPPAPPSSRSPGDSPILSSSGMPLRRANDELKLG